MKKRNLSAITKIHNFYSSKLRHKKIKKIYLKFKRTLDKEAKNRFCVALSGGPDSLALAFLAKYYSIEKKIKIYYFIVDHKLRKESTREAKLTKNKLKKYQINCKILTWKEKKNFSNLQSQARDKRYELIFNECEKKILI